MLIDGLEITETSTIGNARVQSGRIFPTNPTQGLLFFLEAAFEGFGPGLYVYDGSAWLTGDISSVQAGLGLTGGGTSGNISLAIDPDIVVTLPQLADTNAGLGDLVGLTDDHVNNDELHLTEIQNDLLDQISGNVSSQDLIAAQGAKSNFQGQIDAEIIARETADNVIATDLNEEIANRINALEQADQNLQTEILRATAREDVLSARINSEKTRAEVEEQQLLNRITSEQNARTSADSGLQMGIDNLADTHEEDLSDQAIKDSSQDAEIALKLNRAGDAMTGPLAMSGNKISSLAAPTDADDATTKSYVDNRIAGINWLNPVRAVNLISDQLATPPALAIVGDVYIVATNPADGWVSFNAGDIIQFNGNGPTSDASSWTLVESGPLATGDRFVVAALTETEAVSPLVGDTIVIWNGTEFDVLPPQSSDSLYVNDSDSLNFAQSYVYNLAEGGWVQFSGPAEVGDGTGLFYNGNVLNIGLGAGIKELPDDQVGIETLATGGLMLTEDGSTDSIDENAKLSIRLDTTAATLTVDGSGLRVAQSILSNIEANTQAVIAEEARAEASELTLQTNIDNEIQNRQTAITGVDAALTAETTRAQAEEARIEAALIAQTDQSDTHAADQSLHLSPSQNSLLDGLAPGISATEINFLSGLSGNVEEKFETEATVRDSGLSNLTSNLADETNSRQSEDQALSNRINDANTALAEHSADGALHLTAAQNTLLDGLDSDLTAVEINHLLGTSDNIQAQLNALNSGVVADFGAHSTNVNVHLTASQNTLLDGISPSITSDEINHLNGLTGNIQGQVDSEIASRLGHENNNDRHLTAEQNSLLDGISSLISSGEINQLNGITGNIQVQINTEIDRATAAEQALQAGIDNEATARTAAIADTNQSIGALQSELDGHEANNDRHLTSTQNALLDGLAPGLTANELNSLDGVTSNVQAQIDSANSERAAADQNLQNSKLDLSGGTLTGDLSVNGLVTANNMRVPDQLHVGQILLDLGEGLHLTEDNDYFGTFSDARILRMLDGNGTNGQIDGGIVITGFTPTDGIEVELVRIRNTQFQYQGNDIWHAGNDGGNSGLDADLLDGVQGSQYVRSDVDDTVSGRLTLTQGPTAPAHAATKGYVDQSINDLIGGAPTALNTLNELAEAINDDANIAATISADLATKVNKSGDTLSGFLTLHTDPVNANHAATKSYVDASVFNTATENPRAVTGNRTALDGDVLFVDTSGGAITITLPASPAFNTVIEILDGAGRFNTNALTIARNGQRIMGLAENLIVNTQFASFKLRYFNSTHGWRVVGA